MLLLFKEQRRGLLQVPVYSLKDLFTGRLFSDPDPIKFVDLQVLHGDPRVPVDGFEGRPALASRHAGYLFAYLHNMLKFVVIVIFVFVWIVKK